MAQSQSEDLWKHDYPFRSEPELRASDWLLCFSDLQLEPQYLPLVFIIHATSSAQYLGYKFMKKSFAGGLA